MIRRPLSSVFSDGTPLTASLFARKVAKTNNVRSCSAYSEARISLSVSEVSVGLFFFLRNQSIDDDELGRLKPKMPLHIRPCYTCEDVEDRLDQCQHTALASHHCIISPKQQT